MVFEQIQEIIADTLGVDAGEISMESRLGDDLEADSLDILDIITAVEEHFELDPIPDEDLEQMEKVSDLVAYIEGL